MAPHPCIARRIRRIAACCVLLAATVAGGVDSAGTAGDHAKTLVIGAPADSFPYSFVDDTGTLTGFATDLTRAIAAKMHADVRFEVAGSSALTDMLRDGRVDALQLYSHTQEREAFADFSVPFLRLQGALFIASKNRDRLASIEQLRGGRLAVVGVGSTALAFVRDSKLDVTIDYAPSPEAALRWVADGRCDATFLSRLTALSVIKKHRLRGLEILGDPFAQYDVRHCLAVRDGEAQLLARLNEALALIHQDGTYDQIYQQWFVGIDAPMFTREQVVQWAVYVLAGFSLLATWALVRQRRMHRRLRRQSAEIAEQAEMLRALYQNIPVGILVFGRHDDDIRLLAMNDHAARLLSLVDVRGVGLRRGQLPWAPAWLAQAQTWTNDWPRPGAPTHEEQVVDTGNKLVLDVVRVALETPVTGEARLFVLLEDITERKRVGEEVAQGRRLRAIGELVGGIAHEFNNLLSPLLLHASELKHDRPGDEELSASMDVMIDTTKRAAELTQRLLTFGRRDEARVELIDLAAIAQNCAALLRPTLDRRIDWHLDVPPNLPRLPGIAADLQQVLLNLLINARDALAERMEAGPPATDGWTPRLQVTARHHPTPRHAEAPLGPAATTGWIELVVEDNGSGIDAKIVERIFEPFFTTKDVGRGTGLGLATAWSMVNKAGGEIRVDSTKGAGARFHVWLPLLPFKAPAAAPKSPTARPAAPRARQVLVVEDEPALVRTICSMLRRGGHAPESCTTGSEAIARIAVDGTPWEAVLLDLNLPGADGITIARTLRARGYAGRIVLMSGRIHEIDTAAPDMPRIDARLPKPFDARDLNTALGF
jgi:signal transduction histidine kinase